ncbi:MAG TPA: hypothetical protein VGF28_15530 [Thermoanaerobaculia bacterium]|jgi:hypothetical protein
MSDRTRGLLIGVLSVAAAATAIFFCIRQEVLWVLVPIPALVGIMYHVLNLQPRYDNRMSVADLYRQFLTAFHKRWSRGHAAPEVSEDAAEDLSSHQPKFSSTLWAAALLTAVLAIPAAVSGGGIDLTFSGDVEAAAAKAVEGRRGLLATPKELSSEATGLVFAGLGVYALIVLRMIGRLNSGSLHARFMITAALRATIAQVLGYFAGAANYFSEFPAVGNTAYFLIGLFYPLFVEQLRDKAIQLFTRKQPVTEPLDVTMIDGIGDDVVEILTELGITDVQHVAASDPAVLSVRSLYPFERVVDWINQAMLIRRFRANVAELRKLNVRGITDWIPLMEPIVNDTAQKDDSQAMLGYIATATGEPVEVVRVFGRATYHDYKTNLLWSLCQHRLELSAPATAEASPPMVHITRQPSSPASATPPQSS